MIGKYLGTYQYSSTFYTEEIRDRKTNFTIEIQHFDGRKFSGIVFDDLTTGGTKGTGTISGEFTKNKIKFIKKMPVRTFSYPDGTTIEEDKPHSNIYYSGELEGDFLKGIWRFKWGIKFTKWKFEIYKPTTGTWEMKKTS